MDFIYSVCVMLFAAQNKCFFFLFSEIVKWKNREVVQLGKSSSKYIFLDANLVSSY